MKEKRKEKKKAYLKYTSIKTQETYDNYKTIRNEAHALVRRMKNDHWERFSKKVEHDFYGQQKEIWRFIKDQRAEVKKLIGPKHIEKDTWIDY